LLPFKCLPYGRAVSSTTDWKLKKKTAKYKRKNEKKKRVRWQTCTLAFWIKLCAYTKKYLYLKKKNRIFYYSTSTR
jgi:hypothetical protein